MSGGYFEYNQHKITEIVEQLQDVIDGYPDERDIPNDIFNDVLLLHSKLKECFTRTHRLDWYLSGDDGEESYRKRLKEELEQ